MIFPRPPPLFFRGGKNNSAGFLSTSGALDLRTWSQMASELTHKMATGGSGYLASQTPGPPLNIAIISQRRVIENDLHSTT